jgi:hypothetical protein
MTGILNMCSVGLLFLSSDGVGAFSKGCHFRVFQARYDSTSETSFQGSEAWR